MSITVANPAVGSGPVPGSVPGPAQQGGSTGSEVLGIDLVALLADWLPFALWVVLVGAGLWLADRVLIRPGRLKGEQTIPRILAMLALSVAGLLALIVALPVDERVLTDQTKSNLITLIGLSITAVVTLSSTTLAANGMAGLMLRGVGSFRIGDFVRVGEQFGRVTERGLFHVEIQTEDRDLVTLPNMHVATNPVRVVRSSGTVVSAEVGLGYDTPHGRVTELLKVAASRAGLDDPFVWIMALDDHAVRYRVAGMLHEIKTLVSARSRLHAEVLDTLHGAGVEIVSPGFVYQRRTDEDQQVIPHREPRMRDSGSDPESKVFDKAETAERVDEMRSELDALQQQIKAMEKAGDEDAAGELEALRRQAASLEARIGRTAPQSE